MDLTRWPDAELESWRKALSDRVDAARRRGWRTLMKAGLQLLGLLVGFGGVGELASHGLNYWAAAVTQARIKDLVATYEELQSR